MGADRTLGRLVRMEIRLLVFSSILSLTFFLRYSSYANGSETAFSLILIFFYV